MSNHNKETEARCPHCYRHYVEGTAAWALYMMRMGHKVTNPKYDPRVYHLPEGRMIQVDGMEIIAGNQWIDYWCIDIPDGWEIYEEPKPLLTDSKVGDLCQRKDGKWVQIAAIRNNGNKWSIYEAEGHSYHESGNSVCSELYHTNLDIISTEPLAPEGTAEWAWQMLKQNYILVGAYWGDDVIVSSGGQLDCEVIPIKAFRKRKGTPITEQDFISHAETNGWQLYTEPEPEPALKVGDWVEYSDGTLQQAIIKAYSGQPGEQMVYVWHPQTAHSAKTPLQSITRKLDPSEVVVHIGCLKGTVAPGCSDATIMIVPIGYNGFGDVAIIPVAMLDAPTRELVESLLKAQEEK
jgi:hypothetical protein